MTEFNEIYSIFYDLIMKDKDFFMYGDLSEEEILDIIKRRSKALLKSAIARLMNSCNPEVNFYDYDDELERFNFECTDAEINLLAILMKEELLKLDEVQLKVQTNYFNTKDLNRFSPAEERKSFLSMLNTITYNNDKMIENYIARDRITGRYKMLNFDYEV